MVGLTCRRRRSISSRSRSAFAITHASACRADSEKRSNLSVSDVALDFRYTYLVMFGELRIEIALYLVGCRIPDFSALSQLPAKLIKVAAYVLVRSLPILDKKKIENRIHRNALFINVKFKPEQIPRIRTRLKCGGLPRRLDGRMRLIVWTYRVTPVCEPKGKSRSACGTQVPALSGRCHANGAAPASVNFTNIPFSCRQSQPRAMGRHESELA
jgi:hypothetical protein